MRSGARGGAAPAPAASPVHAVVLLEQREAATAGASPPRAPLRTASPPPPPPTLSCTMLRSPTGGYGFTLDARMVVTGVALGGAAALAGVTTGMHLLKLQGRPVDSVRARDAAKAQLRAAAKVQALFECDVSPRAGGPLSYRPVSPAAHGSSDTGSDASDEDFLTAVNGEGVPTFVTALSKQIGMPPPLPVHRGGHENAMRRRMTAGGGGRGGGLRSVPAAQAAKPLPTTPALGLSSAAGVTAGARRAAARTPTRAPRLPGQTERVAPSSTALREGAAAAGGGDAVAVSVGASAGSRESLSYAPPAAAAAAASLSTVPSQAAQPLPMLPEGWTIETSRSTGVKYFYNTVTGESTFDFPQVTAEEIADVRKLLAAGKLRLQEEARRCGRLEDRGSADAAQREQPAPNDVIPAHDRHLRLRQGVVADVKVFGVPLADVMARSSEQGEVPRFVDELIRRIEELGGATHSGIFRWPGADLKVKKICKAYDDGKFGAEMVRNDDFCI